MKIFIGQPVTGEDINQLREESDKICNVLSENGNNSYCTILEGDKHEEKSNKDKMKHAFGKLDNYDAFLAIVRNERRSEGMLLEIGYCIAKGKKFIVAVKKEVRDKTYLDELADQVIEFENIDDLVNKLRAIK